MIKKAIKEIVIGCTVASAVTYGCVNILGESIRVFDFVVLATIYASTVKHD